MTLLFTVFSLRVVDFVHKNCIGLVFVTDAFKMFGDHFIQLFKM